MGTESPRQKKTIARVMEEFKQGELKSGAGGTAAPVKSARQAIAIALNEAGAARQKGSPEKPLRQARSTAASVLPVLRSIAPTHAQLMKQARAAGIPGRSRMTKSQLERALRRH
jgi:hypothetical protein